jgi:hypothetical protein
MLFLLTILVILSAVAVLAIFVKRLNSNLIEQNPPKTLSAETFRPLFQPTDEEIRAFERDEETKIEAKKAEEKRRVLAEKSEELTKFENAWRISPDRTTTASLLFMASQSESSKTFSEISENVIKVWQEQGIRNLSARDLAELLDSHFRTLPQQERTSGAIFCLKAEIENLLSQSEVKPDEPKKSSEV